MNGATAWYPAPARAGSRCRQVWAVSGNPCRHSASGPDPASSSPNSSPFARTVADRTGTATATSHLDALVPRVVHGAQGHRGRVDRVADLDGPLTRVQPRLVDRLVGVDHRQPDRSAKGEP